MLDIYPILNGKEAATFEYYAQEIPGVWGGIAAETMDLYGEVTKDQFDLLASNKHPVTREQLTVRTILKRRSWYDCCFDVPKSISIYLAETNDQRMRTLIKESILETLHDMEQKVGTRNRKQDQWSDRTTGNMAYAIFEHSTARPVKGHTDPQWHFHCVVPNCTFDKEENRWKACQFVEIKRNAPEFQRQYHERLISKLKHNRYRVRITKDAFELSSISRDLIEKFSSRSKVINSAVKELGLKFSKALGKIKRAMVFETRERKSRAIPNPTEQQSQWRARMTPMERSSIWESKEKRTTVDPVLTRKRAIMAERIPTQERIR